MCYCIDLAHSAYAFGEDLIQKAIQDLIHYQITYCNEHFMNSERRFPVKNYSVRFFRPTIFFLLTNSLLTDCMPFIHIKQNY